LKRKTLRLFIIASAIYLFVVIVLRSLIPETLTSTVSLLASPLVVLAILMIIDLSSRATYPSEINARETPRRLRARDLQYLARQVEVAAKASPAYFESILLNRLRDLLTEKVSLETGIEKESLKRVLADERFGPRLLKDQETYALLYCPPPSGAEARLETLRRAIDRIERWKA
jgi:hypothetical protein